MMLHPQGPMHGCGCLPRPPVRCCRQEAKELLVQGQALDRSAQQPAPEQSSSGSTIIGAAAAERSSGRGEAIIGGGCCVQLSVEYMPANLSLQDQNCGVAVLVQDSEGSNLGWEKKFKEGYHVKECIITTYPGAKLTVFVENAIARVRWCEIFSC